MSKNEYKAVVMEVTMSDRAYTQPTERINYVRGRSYVGEGVGFSNSVKQAIAQAKTKAQDDLAAKEAANNDAGTPILATLKVFKSGRLIIDKDF